MPERMKPADFLRDPRLKKFDTQTEESISSAYQQALIDGLQGRGSLAMTPSLLSPVHPMTLPEGKTALVLEVGGTHVYAARVQIVGGEAQIMVSDKAPLERRTFEGVSDFLEAFTSPVIDVIGDTAPDALGIVYSFPGETVQTEYGVDVNSPSELSKDFVIPGIDQQPVGLSVQSFLADKFQFKGMYPIVVTNDTIAVALAIGAQVGGVVGTGFNLAVSTPAGLVNTESGGFDMVPSTNLSLIIDNESKNPGKQLAEKQVSGEYLGRQFSLAVGGRDDPKRISDSLFQQGGDADAYKVAEVLRDRSAQLVGIMVGTVVKTFPDIYTAPEISTPVEGSLFWGMPGYVEIATDTATKIAQKHIVFQNIPDAGRVGAGVAALSMIAKN